MGELKGIYFSVDALLASMILLATVSFVIAYNQPALSANEYKTDMLYTSAVQPVDDWNSSIESQKSVLGYIYSLYYSGNSEESSNVCNSYFEFDEKSALYFKDGDSIDKACGDYRPGEKDAFVSETVVPDLSVNQTFIGPTTAVLVIKD